MRPGLGWIALGAAISIGAWRMDRLESLNIEPWSAPGLVPGVLGLGLIAFGLGLAVARTESGHGESSDPIDWPRLLSVLLLCAVFAVFALGRLPFQIAGALLLFAWITLLGWPSWPTGPARWRRLGRTLLFAVLASLVISTIFQDLFLVRLP
jgi:hypothetical protein